MKRILVTFAVAVLAMLAPLAASADGVAKYLTVTMADGAEVSYSLESFRITYDGGNMYVESAGEKFTLPTASLTNMFFSETPTAISAPKVNTAVIVDNEGAVSVNLVQSAVLRVYSVGGALLYSVKMSAGENKADLSSLAKGVYIVTVGGKSLKLEKK